MLTLDEYAQEGKITDTEQPEQVKDLQSRFTQEAPRRPPKRTSTFEEDLRLFECWARCCAHPGDLTFDQVTGW